MTHRPYRLFGDSEQQNAIRQISKELLEWANEWMTVVNQPPRVEVIALSDILREDKRWEMVGTQDVPFVAIGYNGAWPRQSLGLMFADVIDHPDSQSDSITGELALQMVRALAERLYRTTKKIKAASMNVWSAAPPDDIGQPGSPYLAVQCTLESGTALDVLLYPELLDAWMDGPELSMKEPILPVVQAFDNQRVNLGIIVGEGELTIEELSTLATGDVIPLDRKLSQEISVKLAGNGAVCGGFLGGVRGRMAVQVAVKR